MIEYIRVWYKQLLCNFRLLCVMNLTVTQYKVYMWSLWPSNFVALTTVSCSKQRISHTNNNSNTCQ